MGQPAARLGDSTAHGGVIVVGFPMVLIGGQPAARMGDMHVCPMVNPGVPPPPHVGGPITKGSATVLIGGQPAARMGDMCTCAGPPDSIIAGCPTVLIGDGSGSGGGGGGGAAKAAQDAAAGALQAQSAEGTGTHWIEYAFNDNAGNPVTGVKYDFTLPDGSVRQGIFTGDGGVKAGGLAGEGECNVVPYKLYGAKWSKDTARTDDELTLTACVEGYKGGTAATLVVYSANGGLDALVEEMSAQVQGDKIEAKWKYPATLETTSAAYNVPTYYFVATIETAKTRSGMLVFQDWIEVELKDADDKAVANAKYEVTLPSGEVKRGQLDGSGLARIEGAPPGHYDVKFPETA